MTTTVVIPEWSPWVFGPPSNFMIGCTQGRVVKPFKRVCVVVAASTADNGQQFWNGETFVPYDRIAFPTGPDAPLPTGAIAAELYAFNNRRAEVPASVIGRGLYTIRFFADQEGRGFYFGIEWVKESRNVTGPRQPNPEGVQIDSNSGGTDALRIVGPGDRGLVANVQATIRVGPDMTTLRGKTTSGPDGRWSFAERLQPNTLHTITFAAPHFWIDPVQITTAANP